MNCSNTSPWPWRLSRRGSRHGRHAVDLAEEAQCSGLGVIPGVDLGATLSPRSDEPEVVAVPGVGRPGRIELERQTRRRSG